MEFLDERTHVLDYSKLLYLHNFHININLISTSWVAQALKVMSRNWWEDELRYHVGDIIAVIGVLYANGDWVIGMHLDKSCRIKRQFRCWHHDFIHVSSSEAHKAVKFEVLG